MTAEFGRDGPLHVCDPAPCSKQNVLSHIHLGFEYLHGLRFYHHIEQPTPMFDKPHNKDFLTFTCNFPCLNLWALPFALSWHHRRSLTPSSLPPLEVLIHTAKISCLLHRLNNFISFSLSLQVRQSRPIIILTALHWTCFSKSTSFCCWRTQNWEQ